MAPLASEDDGQDKWPRKIHVGLFLVDRTATKARVCGHLLGGTVKATTQRDWVWPSTSLINIIYFDSFVKS